MKLSKLKDLVNQELQKRPNCCVCNLEGEDKEAVDYVRSLWKDGKLSIHKSQELLREVGISFSYATIRQHMRDHYEKEESQAENKVSAEETAKGTRSKT